VRAVLLDALRPDISVIRRSATGEGDFQVALQATQQTSAALQPHRFQPRSVRVRDVRVIQAQRQHSFRSLEKIVSASCRKSEPDWLNRLAACAPPESCDRPA